MKYICIVLVGFHVAINAQDIEVILGKETIYDGKVNAQQFKQIKTIEERPRWIEAQEKKLDKPIALFGICTAITGLLCLTEDNKNPFIQVIKIGLSIMGLAVIGPETALYAYREYNNFNMQTLVQDIKQY
jgi:hypothetical protein